MLLCAMLELLWTIALLFIAAHTRDKEHTWGCEKSHATRVVLGTPLVDSGLVIVVNWAEIHTVIKVIWLVRHREPPTEKDTT